MIKLHDVLWIVGALGIGAAGIGMGMTKAHASDRQPYGFVIMHAPATVPGIVDRASPSRHYRGGPVVSQRPNAAIISLGADAPPNGCEGQGGGFRIEAGPTHSRCTGTR